MRVLGLDPGLRHTGWGVIDIAGNRLTHVADGVVHAATDQPLAMRLVSLFRQITAVLERFQPDRKSTRLNSSHSSISYAVFCLKKKNTQSSITFTASPQLPPVMRRTVPASV